MNRTGIEVWQPEKHLQPDPADKSTGLEFRGLRAVPTASMEGSKSHN